MSKYIFHKIAPEELDYRVCDTVSSSSGNVCLQRDGLKIFEI